VNFIPEEEKSDLNGKRIHLEWNWNHKKWSWNTNTDKGCDNSDDETKYFTRQYPENMETISKQIGYWINEVKEGSKEGIWRK
jgi:hypothetical protein